MAWFQCWCLTLAQPLVTTVATCLLQTSIFHMKNMCISEAALSKTLHSPVSKIYNLARFSWWPQQVFTGVQLPTHTFTHAVFPKKAITKSVSWETVFFLAIALKQQTTLVDLKKKINFTVLLHVSTRYQPQRCILIQGLWKYTKAVMLFVTPYDTLHI